MLFVLHRCFTFAGAAAVIGMLFPHEHFSSLYGLMQCVSLWAGYGPQIFRYEVLLFRNERFSKISISHANLVIAALGTISIWHPIMLFLKSQRGKSPHTEQVLVEWTSFNDGKRRKFQPANIIIKWFIHCTSILFTYKRLLNILKELFDFT